MTDIMLKIIKQTSADHSKYFSTRLCTAEWEAVMNRGKRFYRSNCANAEMSYKQTLIYSKSNLPYHVGDSLN